MKICTIIFLYSLTLPGICFAQGKKNAAYYFDQGNTALEENKFTTAIAHFNECLRLNPYYWEAYHSRASAKEGLKDKKGALTDYSIYLESKPAQAEALLCRAVLRYELNQFVPAREDFLNLLRMPPGPTNAIFFKQDNAGGGTDKMFTLQGVNHALTFNYLGLVETRLKNYKSAQAYLDSAINASPDEPHYLINRGLVKEHITDTSGALSDYRKALSIDSTFGLALHNIAVIQRARGQQNESEKTLNQAILQSPGLPYPYAGRAYYRFKHNDFKGALKDYDNLLSVSPEDEESFLYRGMVKEKLKDLDGAFVDYTQAITLKNDYARAWLSRGTLLAKMNRLPESIEDYTVAIIWNPAYGLGYYQRGIVKQKLGKTKEACEDLAAAERLNIKVDAALKEQICVPPAVHQGHK